MKEKNNIYLNKNELIDSFLKTSKNDSTDIFQEKLNFLKPGSLIGGVLTIVISIIGAGFLSTPLAFYYSGIYFSIFQYILCGYLGYITNMYLVYIYIK